MKVECPRCGTHVEKPLEGDPVCPNCGYGAPQGQAAAGAAAGSPPPAATAPGQPGGPSQPQGFTPSPAGGQPPKQGMAITAMVLSIVGCCTFIFLLNIAGAIVGGIAMSKAKKDPQEYGGYGMALTGLILGIVGAVIGLIVIIAYAALFAAVISGDVPPECWDDPESKACQDALDDQEQQGNNTVAAAWIPAPAVLLGVRQGARPGLHAG